MNAQLDSTDIPVAHRRLRNISVAKTTTNKTLHVLPRITGAGRQIAGTLDQVSSQVSYADQEWDVPGKFYSRQSNAWSFWISDLGSHALDYTCHTACCYDCWDCPHLKPHQPLLSDGIML